jgi:hypothetical protein
MKTSDEFRTLDICGIDRSSFLSRAPALIDLGLSLFCKEIANDIHCSKSRLDINSSKEEIISWRNIVLM